jgi:hypothetical protein
MHNKDVTRKMKTRCKEHFPKSELNSDTKVKELEADYKPIPYVKSYLEKLDIEPIGDISIRQCEVIWEGFTEPNYNLLIAEAYINKLVSAVGYKILFLHESELSSDLTVIEDNELENHINLYLDEIGDIITLFENKDFEKEEVNKIINQAAAELNVLISLPHLLIKQGEIGYNLKMAEANELMADEASAYYFSQNAKHMKGLGGIGDLMMKEFNTKLPGNLFDDMEEKYYDWCIKKIKQFSPGLRKRLLKALELSEQWNEHNLSDADNFDAPF